MNTHDRLVSEPDFAFDILRGMAAYTGSRFVHTLAHAIIEYPRAGIAEALGHKQIASKMWARDKLYETLGARYDRIWLLGGWYAVLSAMLFDDDRFDIGHLESIDVDENCAAVACAFNSGPHSLGRFSARTADMYSLDYSAVSGNHDLVINTSCEHIEDLKGWLDLLPQGTRVLLQSNDYFSEAEHVNCVRDLDAFKRQTKLGKCLYAGSFETSKYTRFMLIGQR